MSVFCQAIGVLPNLSKNRRNRIMSPNGYAAASLFDFMAFAILAWLMLNGAV